jgi:hypothetical protein
MFQTREMRRKDRELSSDVAFEILKKGKYGVMSVVSESSFICKIYRQAAITPHSGRTIFETFSRAI